MSTAFFSLAFRWLLGLYVVALATTMSGMEIFSTALLLAWLVSLPVVRPLPGNLPFWRPILLFVLVAVIGILLGDAAPRDKLYDLGRMRFYLIYAALYYILSQYVRDSGWWKVLFGTTVLVGIYGTVQHFVAIDLFRPEGKKVLMYAIQDQKIGPLVVGTFNHHLTFSNIYLFYACLFTALGMHSFPRKKWLLLHGLWIFLLCVWTESRAAWAAIPASLLCLTWGKGKRVIVAALSALLVILALFYQIDPGFRGRFQRTFFARDDLYSLGPRQRLWAAQIYLFKQSPLVGVGWNNNERKAKQVVDALYPNIPDNFYGHAHSNALQILSTTGLLGLGAFLWLWTEVFLAVLRVIRNWPRDTVEHWIGQGLLAGFVGFQIQGLTQWNFGDAEVIHNYIFFWAVVASLSTVLSIPVHPKTSL